MNPSLSSAHVLSSTPPPAQVLMSYGYGTVVPCSSVLFSFSYCVLQMSLEVLLAQATLPLLELVSLLQPQAGSPQVTNEEVQARLPLLELVVSLEAPCGSSPVTNEQVGDDAAGAAGTASYSVVVVLRTAAVLQSCLLYTSPSPRDS